MSEQAAPATAAASTAARQGLLRGFVNRITSGEFDADGKDYHQFVVKEIYPLMAAGTLAVEDLERITRAYSARADPYNKHEG